MSTIGVVIPAIDEAPSIERSVWSAFAAGADQVVVSDGGSQDGTIDRARACGCEVVAGAPGRGSQLNRGAARCDAEYLLFLHADNWLEKASLKSLLAGIDERRRPLVWGALRQRIDHVSRVYRLIEAGNAARVRLRSMAFGDQAIFVRRDQFERVGGFPEIPLMEDVQLSMRLREQHRAVLLPGLVHVSPRRWQENGPLNQTLRNWHLQWRHWRGECPQELARAYRRHRTST